MDSRVFAVIVGIDQYKSGDIWNLEACVDDAKSMKRWLVDDLGVPKHQIAMLLNERATKRNIEVTLDNHLLNNNRIREGDAILIYFAGHGSTLKAPQDWLSEKNLRCDVEVLCTYDHDTKGPEGRIAGISARAMHTFLHDLSKLKGNNITLMLDSCFSSPPPGSRERSSIRWTATSKAAAEDLYRGQHFCPRLQKRNESFYSRHWTTHTVITACKPGTTAHEGKEGGKLTSAFLETMHSVQLHDMSFSDLVEEIRERMGEAQSLRFSGIHPDRLFNAIPFIQDNNYIPLESHIRKGVRIELGSLHGIEKGRELSLHAHNHIGSRNPAIASFVVQQVYPTWCLGRIKCSSFLPKHCWARVPRNHGVSYHGLRKAFQALLHSAAVRKPPSQTASHTSSILDIKSTKSELIETAEAILVSKTLLAPLLK
ncbi:caspase domain-containing protein [Lentinula raphanica]|nr:caspase domain-containing protein [Lentinula raphanica]